MDTNSVPNSQMGRSKGARRLSNFTVVLIVDKRWSKDLNPGRAAPVHMPLTSMLLRPSTGCNIQLVWFENLLSSRGKLSVWDRRKLNCIAGGVLSSVLCFLDSTLPPKDQRRSLLAIYRFVPAASKGWLLIAYVLILSMTEIDTGQKNIFSSSKLFKEW